MGHGRRRRIKRAPECRLSGQHSNPFESERRRRGRMSDPDLSYGDSKLLRFCDPLRGDPRFERIYASLTPKKIGRQQLARGPARRNRPPHHEWRGRSRR